MTEDTEQEIKWALEAKIQEMADFDAATAHSTLWDQDMMDLEEQGYLDQEAIKIAEFGDAWGVNQDILVSPGWYPELKLKKPKKGAQFWNEAQTTDKKHPRNAISALYPWLNKQGYERVDKLSGAWPGGSEQTVSPEHLVDAVVQVGKDHEAGPFAQKDVEQVAKAVFGKWYDRGEIPWGSASGDIEVFAQPAETDNPRPRGKKKTATKRKAKKNPGTKRVSGVRGLVSRALK